MPLRAPSSPGRTVWALISVNDHRSSFTSPGNDLLVRGTVLQRKVYGKGARPVSNMRAGPYITLQVQFLIVRNGYPVATLFGGFWAEARNERRTRMRSLFQGHSARFRWAHPPVASSPPDTQPASSIEKRYALPPICRAVKY
ncbi:hypothetical protein BJV77DRAFT_963525 [Russula vinacea]|nr:hypothetical protein BJV77DRAFT_963525 [Russula vinacea]